MEGLLILSQVILVCVIIYFIFNHDKKQVEKEKDILNNITSYLVENNKKSLEEISKVQVEHFKQLEKTSSKQLQLLNQQTKEFFKHMEVRKEVVSSGPSPFQFEKIENPIEKEEEREILLTDTDRIPIVQGVNFKFEDEEEIITPNIE